MAMTMSFQTRNGLLDQGNPPGNLHVPMVYEQLPLEPVHWEYHVLVVDTMEMDLPDIAQLNGLGAQGWLLVGIVGQRIMVGGFDSSSEQMTRDFLSRAFEGPIPERSSIVHYYFVRQKSE